MHETGTTEPSSAPELARLLARHHEEFLRFLERRVGRREWAEDILHDAFARGLDQLGTLRDEARILPWFYRVLHNASVDHHRKRRVAERALTRLAVETDTTEPSLALAASGEPTIASEVCRCVMRLASELKPEYAEALARVEIDGVPVKSFAEEHGISPNNAAVRVHRARESLRRRLFACCGACAESGCGSCTC